MCNCKPKFCLHCYEKLISEMKNCFHSYLEICNFYAFSKENIDYKEDETSYENESSLFQELVELENHGYIISSETPTTKDMMSIKPSYQYLQDGKILFCSNQCQKRNAFTS